jgi:hypothetical protein
MKLVKSLLLGSAAGLAAVAGAQAADLPVRKAAAVEYVRVCSTYGAGFFYVPGTEACIKIGGRVRADAVYLEPFTRIDDAIGIRVRGRIQVDHRQATAYGLLRTFIRFEITRNAGGPVGGGTGGVSSDPQVAQAFVQFGGLTAGRVTSFFSNPDLPTSHMGTLRFDDAPDVNLFAYTASFGNGFSATLAVEDGIARRNYSSALFGSPFIGDVPVDPFASYLVAPGGQTVPDIVGNIRYAGTWGSVQLSGALHQIRDAGVVAGRVNPVTGLPLPAFADTEYGWAVGLSASYLLPFLGAGDSVWVSGAYSSGASSYSGFGTSSGFGGLRFGVADAVINPFNGDLEKTDVWNIAGGLTHYWTPQFRSSIFGSYARVEFDSVARTVTPLGATVGFSDFDEWRIGANTFWSPVSGLNLGVEVIYAESEADGRVREVVAGPLGTIATLGRDIGAIEGRFRVQRDF